MNANFRLNTLQQFFRRGEVKTLRGLHGKLYIADDFVLATSANLTGIAFSAATNRESHCLERPRLLRPPI